MNHKLACRFYREEGLVLRRSVRSGDGVRHLGRASKRRPARPIVGWQISSSLRSDLALDALEQAIGERLSNEDERPERVVRV